MKKEAARLLAIFQKLLCIGASNWSKDRCIISFNQSDLLSQTWRDSFSLISSWELSSRNPWEALLSCIFRPLRLLMARGNYDGNLPSAFFMKRRNFGVKTPWRAQEKSLKYYFVPVTVPGFGLAIDIMKDNWKIHFSNLILIKPRNHVKKIFLKQKFG